MSNLSLRPKIAHRLLTLAMGALYYAAIASCCYFYICPIFRSEGMRWITLPLWAWMASALFALLPMVFLPINISRPSDFASWILYLCLLSPGSFILLMVSGESPENTSVLLAALLVSFFLFEYFRRRRPFRLSTPKSLKFLFDIMLPIVTLALTLFVFSLANFNIKLSFGDLYTRRFAARMILVGGSLTNYLVSFLGSVCMPVAVIYAIDRRKWYYMSLVVLIVISIFSLDGEKAIVFTPILMVGMSLKLKRSMGISCLWLLGGICAVVLLSVLEPVLLGSRSMMNMLIHRELIMPSLLTADYWDFYSLNPHVYMKDTIIGFLIPTASNYPLPKALTIGLHYFHDIKVNANVNIWASAFADFGYYGMFVTSIVAGSLLRLVDSMAMNDKRAFACICCVSLGLTWVNMPLYTSLITNGGLGLILALYFYSEEGKPRLKRAGALASRELASLKRPFGHLGVLK